jgi:low temperature requirement protein LtrA
VTQAETPKPRLEREDLDEAEVSPLELFFDLVFVFALTQVTAYMAHEIVLGHGVEGLVRGVMVLALLWWSWTGYAWLANVSSVEQPTLKLTILAGMSAMFMLALSIPEAFDDGPGGLDGPLVLALAYLAVRTMHFVMFWLISREDDGLRGQLARFAPTVAGSSIVLVVASQTDGHLQTALWALALGADYLGTWLGGASGWRLPSPGHFSERHGLIIIIALGESIVATGVGVSDLPISWPILVAAAFGLVLASAMWWAYFDVTALVAERALADEPVETRARLARTAFTFAHLPLVVAIVVTALGLKKVLEYVGDTSKHDLSDPLKGVALGALVGGVAVYLAAHVLFKWLVTQQVSVVRLCTAVVLLAAWAPLAVVPALGQLGVVAAIVVASLVLESLIYAEQRHEIRDAHLHLQG